MAARRLSEGRVTYTTPDEVAALAAGYYERVTQHKPDKDKKGFFLAAARAGLDVSDLWEAIDGAVSACGLGRYEIDYWQQIEKAARQRWQEMHKTEMHAKAAP